MSACKSERLSTHVGRGVPRSPWPNRRLSRCRRRCRPADGAAGNATEFALRGAHPRQGTASRCRPLVKAPRERRGAAIDSPTGRLRSLLRRASVCAYSATRKRHLPANRNLAVRYSLQSATALESQVTARRGLRITTSDIAAPSNSGWDLRKFQTEIPRSSTENALSHASKSRAISARCREASATRCARRACSSRRLLEIIDLRRGLPGPSPARRWLSRTGAVAISLSQPAPQRKPRQCRETRCTSHRSRRCEKCPREAPR